MPEDETIETQEEEILEEETPEADPEAKPEPVTRPPTPEEIDAHIRAQGYVKPEPVAPEPVKQVSAWEQASKELGSDADVTDVMNRMSEITEERAEARAMARLAPLIGPTVVSGIRESLRVQQGDAAAELVDGIAQEFGIGNLSNPKAAQLIREIAVGRAALSKSIDPPRRVNGQVVAQNGFAPKTREEREVFEAAEEYFGKGFMDKAMPRIRRDMRGE
jgi:hypothetical protein